MSENYKYPSRHLNEKSVLLGLSYTDISGLGSFLIALILILSPLQSESTSYISLFTTLGAAVLLIPIRLTKRRRIVRDFLKFLFQKKVIK